MGALICMGVEVTVQTFFFFSNDGEVGQNVPEGWGGSEFFNEVLDWEAIMPVQVGTECIAAEKMHVLASPNKEKRVIN